MPGQRIIAIHLLNDLSGSPFVFGQALETLHRNDFEVHLFTATPSGYGFLTGLDGVISHRIPYRHSRNRWFTLAGYLFNQLIIFIRLLFFLRRKDIVYINSMLPFGAALAGRLRSCEVIYHIHEVSIRPALLKRWLITVIEAMASYCIYVSHYCQLQSGIRCEGQVIYNALPGSFTDRAEEWAPAVRSPYIVLMACSLKVYKGIHEFIDAARAFPGLRFELVLNAREDAITSFLSEGGLALPQNLSWFAAQADMHSFYKRASLVLNLSHTDQWVETFGMTVLEAMYYGVPVIVPPVGGVTELVDDGLNGYYVDSSNREKLIHRIRQLTEDWSLYTRMSAAAWRSARKFSKTDFDRSLVGLFQTISVIKQPENLPL